MEYTGENSLEKLFVAKKYNISLDDVILSKENKIKINNFIEEYKMKNEFKKYGVKPNSRLLFCGHTGCGKTTLAKAISNKLGYYMIYVDLSALISDKIGEMSYNLHQIFRIAENQPCVVFFDEFDAIARDREEDNDVSDSKIVNVLLQALDNYENDETIIIAATNIENTIDRALLRRFDEIFYFKTPDIDNINKTIYVKMQNFPYDVEILSDDVKLVGYTYADIEQVCHNSIKYCIIHGLDRVTKDIFDMAIDKQKSRNRIHL